MAEITDDERRLQQEHESFIKTALIAYSANFWAINKSMQHDQIARGSLQLAEIVWQEFLQWRKVHRNG